MYCSCVTGRPRHIWQWLAGLQLGFFLYASVYAGDTPQARASVRAEFSIPRLLLADTLDRFGEQSGLQIVYDAAVVEGLTGQPVNGTLRPLEALERLLAGSGLQAEFVDDVTIAIRKPTLTDPQSRPPVTPGPNRTPAARNGDETTSLSVVHVTDDPRRTLPNEASTSTFGFAKPLLETPRSVSFISQETIDLFGLSAVEDLVRVVPGTFTTTRFGIQGSIDIRNVAADTYFRGMKRVNLQGHGRTVLAAMDAIEIVRGPPSPLYGMGRIGGYTVMEPKSGRAALGGYLENSQGFVQATVGAYGRAEAASGIGGPIRGGSKVGGFYLYGLLESSDSYTEGVPVTQKVGQAAVSLDDFIGPFRLESGINYQLSGTAGALTNRVTQALVDHSQYVRGAPLASLDRNGNGKIGYREMHSGSPVQGNLGLANQPLAQRFAWPTDTAGAPLAIEDLPRVPGIPRSMYDYLEAHQQADPGGLLRAQGVGGPLPQSGFVPIGMVLDPHTVGYDTLDLRRAGSYEKDVEAEFLVGYLDLIYDENPDLTIRNQLFFDSMDQFKISEQPGGGEQDVHVWENKLTFETRLTRLHGWLAAKAFTSVNFRHTKATGRRYGGDFGNHRTDVMDGTGAMTPDTTFVHPLENADPAADGAPWTSQYETRYWESGLGLLLDVNVRDRTNVLVGLRYDGSQARNTDFAAFDPLVGTSSAPGEFRRNDISARGWDHGVSFSLSVSREVVRHMRPYATFARSSLTLESNNNKFDNDVIAGGHVGSAQLAEVGVKASLLDEQLFLTTAVYEQTRIDVDDGDAPAAQNAEVIPTLTHGWETEIKWVPSSEFMLSAYALRQKTRYRPNLGANIMVDARTLGFMDVLDAEGNVVYPAEAFLYGGRAFIALPAGLAEYEEKQGNPPTQLGVSMYYQPASDFGVAVDANYFSGTYSGRLKLVALPAAVVFNAGLVWRHAGLQLKLDILNLLDRRYFRARTGETLGETLVQAMPDRRWQLTLRKAF